MTREEQIRESFQRHGTDKFHHNYAPIYATIPPDIGTLLEIGSYRGASARAWLELFPTATIYGLDIRLPLGADPLDPRCHFIEADMRTFDFSTLLDMDVIIDDATHEVADVLGVWAQLQNKFRQTYIIEDLYLERFPLIWNAVTSSKPNAQVQFWRTSNRTGDERCPSGDSHCLKVTL